MKLKNIWLAIPVVFFGLFLSVALGWLIHGKGGIVKQEGRPVPALQLKSLEDTDVSASDLTPDLRHDWVLVNFFASWCTPCAAEMAYMGDLGLPRLKIVGIAYKDKPEAIRKFLKKNGNPYALVALDADGMMAIEWGLTGVPESFLVDTKGKIVAHLAGPLNQNAWERVFMPYLVKAAP